MKDLNREVAEKVMGWHIIESWWVDKRPQYRVVPVEPPYVDKYVTWNPLQDLNQCFEVVEKMNKLGFSFSINNHTIRGAFREWVAIFYDSDFKQASVANANTPNEAILKAALEAVKE